MALAAPTLGLDEQYKILRITGFVGLSLAAVTTGTRMAMFWKMHKKLQADDYMLLFSFATLAAGMSYSEHQSGRLLEIGKLNMNALRGQIAVTLDELLEIIQELVHFFWTAQTLMTTSVYSTKLSYLLFLFQLVTRMKSLKRYWWAAVVVTLLSYTASLAAGFAYCPWTDLRAVQCTFGDGAIRGFRLAYTMQTLDIITDVMIVVVPIVILRKVKMRTSQKFGLASFLCLSIIVAVFGIIRVSRFRTTAFNEAVIPDSFWFSLWGNMEACVSVCLVSMTAFRSFFVLQKRTRQEEERKKKWCASAVRRLRGNGQKTDSIGKLPSIPSATITGLSSFFQKGDVSEMEHDKGSMVSDEESAVEIQRPSQIMVTKTFAARVEETRKEQAQTQHSALDWRSSAQSAPTAVASRPELETTRSSSSDGRAWYGYNKK